MKRENMKEIMEIEQLKRSGRDLIIVAILIAAGHFAYLVGTPVDEFNRLTVNGVSNLLTLFTRIIAAIGVAKYYEAKGRTSAWAILVFLTGFLGAIPYVFLKDLRSPKDD